MLVLLKHLIDCRFAVPPDLLTAAYRMYHGDLLEGGRGEILLRSA
jgi:hypothetical protein